MTDQAAGLEKDSSRRVGRFFRSCVVFQAPRNIFQSRICRSTSPGQRLPKIIRCAPLPLAVNCVLLGDVADRWASQPTSCGVGGFPNDPAASAQALRTAFTHADRPAGADALFSHRQRRRRSSNRRRRRQLAQSSWSGQRLSTSSDIAR